jgi:hypothetical protein
VKAATGFLLKPTHVNEGYGYWLPLGAWR